MLRDAAGFPRRDARLADRIHERGLAVVHVSHKRDDRAARLEFLFRFDDRWRGCDHDLRHLVHAAAFLAAFHLEDETVVRANLRCDVRLNRLGRVCENVEINQLFDQDVILDPELSREIPHDDRRFDVNDLLRFCVFRFRGSGLFGDRQLDGWGSGRSCTWTGDQVHDGCGCLGWRGCGHDRFLRRSRRDDTRDGREEGTCCPRRAVCSFRARLLFVNQRKRFDGRLGFGRSGFFGGGGCCCCGGGPGARGGRGSYGGAAVRLDRRLGCDCLGGFGFGSRRLGGNGRLHRFPMGRGFAGSGLGCRLGRHLFLFTAPGTPRRAI